MLYPHFFLIVLRHKLPATSYQLSAMSHTPLPPASKGIFLLSALSFQLLAINCNPTPGP